MVMTVRFSLKAPWSKNSQNSVTNSDRDNSGVGLEPRLYASPERYRNELSGSGNLDSVREDSAVNFDGGNEEDDEDDELEEELAAEGLYRGSYRRLLALYTFAPLSFIAAFVFLALLPIWAYPLQIEPTFPSLIPFPLPELVVSAGLWSLSYLLHSPIYALCVFLCTSCGLSHYSFSTVLSTFLHVILSLTLRLLSIPVLLIPRFLVYETPTWRDPAFRRVWWVGLGWAAVEAIVAIKQGYENIALYRDVLVEDKVRYEEARFIGIEDGAAKLGRIYGATTSSLAAEPTPGPFVLGSSRDESPLQASVSSSRGQGSAGEVPIDLERVPLLRRSSERSNEDLEASLELQVDEDLEQLMTVKARDELEKYYGVSFIRIPVFVPCLQRANDLLFSLGITLLLSFAYLHATTPSSSPSSWYTAAYVVNTDSSLNAVTSHAWPWSPMPSRVSLINESDKTKAIKIVLPLVFLIHLALSLMHSQLVLPKAGVHTVVYIGTLVSLGVFFAGLSVWDALS